MKVESKLKTFVGRDVVAFRNKKSQDKMYYKGIKVWDSEGKELVAYFSKLEKDEFSIVVNTKDAFYPITIDPLSTTADWTAESNQADAEFGYSVSTAGDVNGDGFSDVIVGAPYYDNGETNEGGAFVYHGSSTGLSTTANWTAESNQTSAEFGFSVSTAGDVNGDGYSDVIVGAHYYDNGEINEGRTFVYHGSSSGLSGTASWTAESNQTSAEFGWSVSTAGDVNGDGYSDVIVGSLYYDNGQANEGRAIVYHGSSTGLSTAENWTAESNQESAYFGFSVSTAGDVNGDGYSDVIVGSRYYDNGQINEGRAFVYHGSSSGLSTTSNWTAESNQESAEFGWSVSTAGDVNGDGYSDVIVGARYYDNGETNEGGSFVYHGSSSGLSTTTNWTAESNQADAYFGYSVSTAGDVNGDGYSDVIVGARYYDNGETDEGRAFVYHGSSTGLSTTTNWTAESNQAGAHFGNSVSTAGDVNGDGYSDVIVGARYYDNGQTNEGSAFIYHGSSSGLSTTSNWTAESNQGDANFGSSVSTAGDVNGDGYSDVIIGAYAYDNGQTDEGKAFVYHGSASGLNTTANWSAESNNVNAQFGWSVCTAGDVNGDGYSDVIVGAKQYNPASGYEGRAFVYQGSSTGLSTIVKWIGESFQANAEFGFSVSTAGDVNGDGYSDVIVGAPYYDKGDADEGRVFVYHGTVSGLSGTASWTAESNQEIAKFGFSVSTAGDVNGDGYSDVIVGAYAYDNGERDEGKAFVYYGSSSGLSKTANWTAESNQDYAGFGFSVSTAGDVNGDGYSDVIVGAYRYDNGETDEGRAFVYHGSSSGLSGTANWTAESNQANAWFGNSVSTAGDVNRDGYSDVIVGAYYYDNGQTDEGSAFVYHGSSSGLSTTSNWTAESDQVNAQFGWSVSTAGDVNGDGYSDVIVGAYYYDNGQTNEGSAFVYYGNGGTGLRNTIQQYKPSTTTILGPDGLTGTDGQVKFGLFGKSPFGRADGKLVWEYKRTGQPFGSIVSSSGEGSFTDLGTTITGVELNNDVSGITTGYNYRWRARVKYSPVNNPYQVYGPWRYYEVYQPKSFGSFKSQDSPLPVELVSFSVECRMQNVELNWTTATEVNNYGFEIERSVILRQAQDDNKHNVMVSQPDRQAGLSNHDNWEKIGFVPGYGNSNSPKEYSFVDKNRVGSKIKYRLRQIDNDGSFKYSGEVEVNIEAPKEFSLEQNYPNPFNPSTRISFNLPTDVFVSLKVFDVLGREVSTLIAEELPAGTHSREWNGSALPSGIYFYRLWAGSYIETRKLVILR
ncbi:MAG: FG-GAP-like repeat-containing protein [Stygiobacter sp.]